MKSFLLFLPLLCLFIFSSLTLFAQEAEKTVILLVSGQGKTQE